MDQITIVHPDGTTLPLFSRDNKSGVTKATQKMALLSDDLLSISVTSATNLNINFGDVINVYGKPYKLNQLPQVKKLGTRKYEYEIELEGIIYELIDIQFQMPANTYGDNLYTDLAGLLDALIWNINRVASGTWSISNVVTGTTAFKNVQVGTKNCLQVLQEACTQYGVEFTATLSGTTRVLTIGTNVGTTHTFTLKYGRGNGLYQLQRTNVNNAGIVTRLFCYGGTENLGNAYRHTRLCLPDKERLASYVEDAEAIGDYGIKEATKQFDDIKPERVGAVTAVGTDNVLTFLDTNDGSTVIVNNKAYPAMFDLNEEDEAGNTKYLIPDTPAQIKFLTGNLAGYTFDVHSYNHQTKTFIINSFTDENGLVFPSTETAARQFAAGDEYIITEINLPDSYVEDAETRLETKGTEELGKLVQPQVSYKLYLDEFFFIDLWGRVDNEVFQVGDFIKVQDDEIGVSKAVRIVRIERDLLRPHSYDITLSDTTSKTISTRVLNELTEIEGVIATNKLGDVSKARRRWMATRELYNMVFDTEGYYYSEKIAPLAIETTMLSVAAKSQQFTLVGALFEPNLGGDCNAFAAGNFQLVHYALFENVCTFAITGATYSTDSGNALATNSAYYIYARCAKADISADQTTGTGQLVLDTTQHTAEDTLYYYFLIGVLNSAVDSVRAISLTYGATTINGAFITTGRIQSQDENTWLDLDGNAFCLGDGSANELSWNKNGNGKLVIKGGLVQNAGGDEAVIGLYRGVYSASATYYPGDEVTYTANNLTSTYRRIGTGATTGVAPSNTTYWQVHAQGVKGDPGDAAVSLYKSTAFIRLPSEVTSLDAPTGGTWDSPVPTSGVSVASIHATFSWSEDIPSGDLKLWATTRTFYSDNRDGTWSTPRPMTDTETYDVEFSDVDTDPGNPTDNPTNWHDPSESGIDFTAMKWRAEREYKNGEWGSWTIVRIKGETGDDAELYMVELTANAVKVEESDGTNTFTPGNVTVKVVNVKGSTRTELTALPTGYYYKITRSNASTSTTTLAMTTIPNTVTTGTLFSNGTYNLARLDLYDDNDEVISSASVVLSKDGEQGEAAPYYVYKYQWTGSRTTAPAVASSSLNPGDAWTETQGSSPGTLYYLWRIFARVSGDGTTLLQNWSTPVRETPAVEGRKIYVKGTRHNGTTVTAPSVMVDDTTITGSYARGHNLRVLNASSLEVVYSATFDTYGDLSESTILTNTNSLISALEDYMNANYIIVLFSYDAISVLSRLFVCLQQFGCGFKTQFTGKRYNFAFIGRYGLKPGQGILAAGDTTDYVEITGTVLDGELISSGASGEANENLVNNSEFPETYDVEDSTTSEKQFIRTEKVFSSIPEGMTVSGQVRITLSGCTFRSGGGEVLVYFGSTSSWPTIGYLSGVTENGTYDLKTERVNVNSGESGWNSHVYIRLANFIAGGTVTIERVKVEVGLCTPWTPSKADQRGAATPYRGVYNSASTYYGTILRCDIVKYNSVYYIARADVGAFTGILPTNTDYWNEFGGQFESVATQLLFAEFAYIENLGVHDLLTNTSGKRVHVSQDENAISIYDENDAVSVVMEGEEYEDSELFGGTTTTAAPTSYSQSFQTGNALHANATYDTGMVSQGTITTNYAGQLSGSVVLNIKSTGSYTISTGQMSQAFSARIYVYIDNAVAGSASISDVPATGSVTVPVSKSITAGTHTFYVRVIISNPYYDSSSSYTITATATFGTFTASGDVRMSRYFANGSAVGCASQQYIETLIANNLLLHRILAGNVGIELYNGTLRIRIGGTWYTASRDASTGALILSS